MIVSMNPNHTQRVTVSLPATTYHRLMQRVSGRQVSATVAKALHLYLSIEDENQNTPIESFLKLSKKLPKYHFSKIKKAINFGRP